MRTVPVRERNRRATTTNLLDTLVKTRGKIKRTKSDAVVSRSLTLIFYILPFDRFFSTSRQQALSNNNFNLKIITIIHLSQTAEKAKQSGNVRSSRQFDPTIGQTHRSKEKFVLRFSIVIDHHEFCRVYCCPTMESQHYSCRSSGRRCPPEAVHGHRPICVG